MNYRTASIEDMPILLNFGKKLFFIESEFDPTITYSQAEAESRYTKQFDNPLALFLIAETNEKLPVGYLYAHIDNAGTHQQPRCEIEVIFVDATYRGQGIATEFVRLALDWAKKNNVTIAHTHIFARNSSSIRMFRKLGFKPHNVEYLLRFE